jgi:ParB-like chromosome segregation protein Spo0J
LEYHDYANLFEMMEQYELERLAERIKANGLLHAIVLLDGKILDGRNRYQACLIAGVEPEFRQFAGSDPLAFVLDENHYRRHYKDGQRAMMAARVANAEHGGDRSKSPIDDLKITREEAAKTFGVSPTMVDRARVVLNSRDEELIRAVEKGEKAVSAAAEEVKTRKRTPAVQPTEEEFDILKDRFVCSTNRCNWWVVAGDIVRFFDAEDCKRIAEKILEEVSKNVVA